MKYNHLFDGWRHRIDALNPFILRERIYRVARYHGIKIKTRINGKRLTIQATAWK